MVGTARAGRRTGRQDQDGGGGVREPAFEGARHGREAAASESRRRHRHGRADPSLEHARRRIHAASAPRPAYVRDPHAPAADSEGEGGAPARGRRRLAKGVLAAVKPHASWTMTAWLIAAF